MGVNSIGGITSIDVKDMDLESAMMAVQSNRANLLETQLKDQIAAIQAKNDKIAKLNNVLADLNAINDSTGSASSERWVGDFDAIKEGDYKLEKEINTLLHDLGMTPFGDNNCGRMQNWDQYFTLKNGSVQDQGKNDTGTKMTWLKGGICHTTTKGELQTAITSVKAQIDNLSNTQQMDMLRLQSLSNKRNEAYDLMTNFIKKMTDGRNSILGNMR